MTRGPRAPIFGDHSLETAEPADIRQKSMPRKSNCSRSWHLSVLSPKETSTPIERREAIGKHFVDRKLALGEDIQHFAAHIARGADDCNLVTHAILSFSTCSPGSIMHPPCQTRLSAVAD